MKQQPSFSRHDSRGSFLEISNSIAWKSVNIGILRSAHTLGKHYHKKSKLLFTVISGEVLIEVQNIVNKEYYYETLFSNESVLINPLEAHEFTALKDSRFLIMKDHIFSEVNKDLFDQEIDKENRIFI